MAALSVDGTPMPALPNSADQINYNNTTSGLSATTVKGAVDELASEKQDKSDDSLQTTDKTIPGAINELKSGLTGKIDSQIYNETPSQSDDDAIKNLFDDIDIYDKPIAGAMGYGGWWLYIAYKYTGGNHGCLVAFRFDGAAKFLSVIEGVKTIRPFAFGS